MILPAAEAIKLGFLVGDTAQFVPQVPSNWGWTDVSLQSSVQTMPHQEIGSPVVVPSFTSCQVDTMPTPQAFTPSAQPQPHVQVLETSFHAESNTYQVLWQADARKLHSHDRSLVSPGFDLPCGVFKLVVTPRGN